jgi:pimeloyl-ACP methyl ester carboxylesterase
MTGQAIVASSRGPRATHYLEAEQALWEWYGLQPTTTFVELGSPRVRLRVLGFGSGRPVLFVHGTFGPGGFAPLVAALPGFRSLVLDRPGWGLSGSVEFSNREYRTFVADLLRDALDELDIDRVDVVGGSIGDVWALSLAEHHPSRVDRIVLLGGGPIVSDVRVPPVIRVLASPIGAIMVRLPLTSGRLRSILRESGHDDALEDGRVPAELVGWRLAVANDTASMRHERDMVRRVVRGSGWRPGFMFEERDLGRIAQPTMLVYGTADRTGSVEIWRRVTGALPDGELLLMDGAGHHPWFEDQSFVAAAIGRFLSRPAVESTPLGSAYAGRSRSAGPT